MLRTRIDADFRIPIPKTLQAPLHVGDELLITTDPAGRLIIIPEARIRSILERTAGLWRERPDLPADGVEYVNQLRAGRRLRDLGVTADGD
jgi:hypothetical protein